MKYYAHHGHKDFILCLGYRGNSIKDYFLRYNECESNDFILSNGGKKVELLNSDIDDWRITFADTGLHSNLAQRLKKVRSYLDGDETFLANYSDGLTDLPLNAYLERFRDSNCVASFLSVKPSQSFHCVLSDDSGRVVAIKRILESDTWINGGFFALRKEIFDYIEDGEELVEEVFQRLIEKNKLLTLRYKGFWAAMDTFKDKVRFDSHFAKGNMPWEVWNHNC
jgi:glucose-1-phosphate cytidylyltransferase